MPQIRMIRWQMMSPSSGRVMKQQLWRWVGQPITVLCMVVVVMMAVMVFVIWYLSVSAGDVFRIGVNGSVVSAVKNGFQSSRLPVCLFCTHDSGDGL